MIMDEDYWDCNIPYFIVIISVLIGVFLGFFLHSENSISAMDVYQGKTTLEYRIVDGVKVDSTIIWKEEL